MALAATDHVLIAPGQDELAAVAELDRLIRQPGAGDLRIVNPNGQVAPIPASVLRLLQEGVAALAAERGVIVNSLAKELTLDEVEAYADLPRADVERLLDDGVVPSRVVAGMRVVRFEDAQVLKRRQDAVRTDALQFLADQGQEIESLLEGERTT
ncbi:MAG: hypothetical protein ACRDJH_25640 [Thermomicrobiales bacterium]